MTSTSRFGVIILLASAFCGCATSPPSTTPILHTGTVRFDGLTPAERDGFRIIPEETTALFTPDNRTYTGVDGFWWRQRPGSWFKIPGGARVVVHPTPGTGTLDSPANTERSIDCEVQTSREAALYQRLKGPASRPGWHPASTARPF